MGNYLFDGPHRYGYFGRQASLDGVRLKVERARHHFDAVAALANTYRTSKYGIAREVDANAGVVNYVLKMPPVDKSVPVIVGDCLHNLRTALDHLVWQLVILNGGTPSDKNMFPICSAPEMWVDALKRDRLCGVGLKATNLIERLQPYMAAVNRPLWTLRELENIDKHRTLILTTGAVLSQEIDFFDPTTKQLKATVERRNALIPDRDGTVVFGCGIGSGSPYENVEAQSEGTCSIALEESLADGEIRYELGQLVDFVEKAVIPRFEPLF